MASFRKALELDPNNPLAIGVMAQQVWKTGDLDGSIAMFEKIEEMDPLSAIWPVNRYTVLLRALRYEEALAANERFFLLSGNRSGYDQNRAIAFELLGRYQESWELSKNAPNLPNPMVGKAILLFHLGRVDEAEAMRVKLEQSGAPHIWFHLAKIYARWGDIDSAFEQLSETNVSQIRKSSLQFDPHLEALKSDPRWQLVVENAIPVVFE
jgi:tetratricopeptide (TPR) repeat protein